LFLKYRNYLNYTTNCLSWFAGEETSSSSPCSKIWASGLLLSKQMVILPPPIYVAIVINPLCLQATVSSVVSLINSMVTHAEMPKFAPWSSHTFVPIGPVLLPSSTSMEVVAIANEKPLSPPLHSPSLKRPISRRTAHSKNISKLWLKAERTVTMSRSLRLLEHMIWMLGSFRPIYLSTSEMSMIKVHVPDQSFTLPIM
jgi:hypothetical protein